MVTRQKASGAYYTPRVLADFLTKSAIDKKGMTVLDPSCGEGVFLDSACERLLDLGTQTSELPNLVMGVDSDHDAVTRLRKSLASKYGSYAPRVVERNFFETGANEGTLDGERIGGFDVVIGNPPYIRYHLFAGKQREVALAAARRQGVNLNRLSSAWAPFVVHACQALDAKGKLCMVLPAELLQVDYATNVRKYLLSRFKHIEIVAFDKRVFADALEDTLLVRADSASDVKKVILYRLKDATQLEEFANVKPVSLIPLAEVGQFEKWTPLLLPEDLRGVLSAVSSDLHFQPIGELGSVDIGVVSGNNELFVVRPTVVSRYKIEEDVLTPIVSGARQLSGLRFAKSDLERLKLRDDPSYLIDASKSRIDFSKTNAYRYLKTRGNGRREAFKIRTRKQWYLVPATYVPDCFMTYMIGDIPHLVANNASATSTNSVHRLSLSKNSPPPEVLAFSFYNSVTLLSCELNGRSYGGGVLKLETKEAEKVLVPRSRLRPSPSELEEVDQLLRSGNFEGAVSAVDGALVRAKVVNEGTITEARRAWQILFKRRQSRMVG